jgi:methyl-accepting chemotaxis protein
MSPVVLVVLIAWALLSVLFLTGTLLAARSIDRSVAVIKPNVIEIGDEGAFIRQAKTIAGATVKIRAAAAPLSGHLARTLVVAQKGIDPKLRSILGKVGQINETAGSINGTVLAIGTTVDSIFVNADSINNSVHGIGSSVDAVNTATKEINASARGILSSGNAILDRVNSIDRAVATIVGLATSIDGTLNAVAKDFVGIDENVGQENRGGTKGPHIVGHTNSIDCAAEVQGPGCKR